MTDRFLLLTRLPLPTPAEHRVWMCEAGNLRFNRATCRRLCWARWYWRVVRECGPTRRRS
jgi:hypothetical protein